MSMGVCAKTFSYFVSYQYLEEIRYLLSPCCFHFAEYHDLKINPAESSGNYTYHLLPVVHAIYVRDFP